MNITTTKGGGFIDYNKSILIAGAMLTNCQSKAVKEDKTHDKVQDSKTNLEEAQINSVKINQDTISLYQKFLNESEDRINANEKNIAKIKGKIAIVKKEEKSRYEKKLVQLEEKNKVLKTQIVNYKDKQIEDWKNKQIEFRKDLDELGSAIANFFVNEEE